MWQRIAAVLGSKVAWAGGFAIKVWHVIAVGTVVVTASAGTYTYVRYVRQATTPVGQHVLVFIGGLNTRLHACQQDAFYGDANTQGIRPLLSSDVGVADPYTQGCNGLSRGYLQASSSMALYSYVGGHMDAEHGVWLPNDYDPCNVDNLTLQSDIQGFDHMLDLFRQVYPQATFTVVGHSLGGLVALQGAYDYTIALHHAGTIDRVLTIDSPLNGVRASVIGQFAAAAFSGTCASAIGGSGSVVDQDILPLGEAASVVSPVPLEQRCGQPAVAPGVVLSSCAALTLVQAGTSVVTLGNQEDSLYCNAAYQLLRDSTCATQVLVPQAQVFAKMFDLAPLPGDSSPFKGHGTILQTTDAESQIIRELLAPVVNITAPHAGDIYRGAAGGNVSVPFSATVHCLWGAPNPAHPAQAMIFPPRSTTAIAVGTATLPTTTGSGETQLALQGTANLSASQSGPGAIFFVDAAGDTCQYPAGTRADALPDVGSYYGGRSAGIRFTLFSAPMGQITEFPLPSNRAPYDITAGPDGALWFTECGLDTRRHTEDYCDATHQIGRITTSGQLSEFRLPSLSSCGGPDRITAGPDGALWFTEQTTLYGDLLIGRITTSGQLSEFRLPSYDCGGSITAGPDGALWFTQSFSSANIGRMTVSGQITEFPVPSRSTAIDIIAGPDGNVWFTEGIYNTSTSREDVQIGRITTSGQISESLLPPGSRRLNGITAGPDGSVWFTECTYNTSTPGCAGGKIGRITTSGQLSEFPLPTANGVPLKITAGPDGALWFTEAGGKIGRITVSGQLQEFSLPSSGSNLGGITAGPDGALWFTEAGGKIGRITA